jgi:hypothetical protein
MQQNRRYLPDSAMGSVLVVVPALIPQLFPGVFKAHEPVGVQAFRPQLAVERLNERVVGRLSRSAEVERDTVGIGPGQDRGK